MLNQRYGAFSLEQSTRTKLIPGTRTGFRLVAFLFVLLRATMALGQTPGYIYLKAGTGSSVLDPNGDGYTSTSASGFASSDYTESEIPYKPLPVIASEPTSDVATGPSCGFTDFVDNGNEQPSYTYLSAANNLMFRFRLGNTANNSKGYSILIDTDQKFGNSGGTADPNYTANNPGFEIEIELATNFGVRLYNVDGVSTPSTYLVQLPYADYAQKSVALTTQCSTPDYFYDFYIPFSVITSYFPALSTATPLRMVANTVISPQSALHGISDISGFDDNSAGGSYTTAWTQLITNFPATAATALGSSGTGFTTSTPVVTSPLSSGTVKVSGTSTAADGTIIRVYVNGSLYGSTTVTSNAWTFTWTAGGSTLALSTGQTVYATAQTGSQPVSSASNTVTVIGCSSPPVITSAASVSGGGGKDVSGTSSEPTGTTVSVYINGGSAQTTTVLSSGTWVISPGSTVLGNGDVLTASTSVCGTSARFYFCKSGGTVTATPTVNTPTAGATSVTGTCVSGATVDVYKNGSYVGTAVTSGTSWSFSTTVANCDYYYAYAKSGSNSCYSAASTTVLVSSTLATAPVITGTYCSTGAQTVSGTSSEASGTTIQLYKAGSTLLGTTTVNSYGYWSLSSITLASGDALTAKATPALATCKQTSAASSPVTVGSATALGSLAVTSPVTEGASSVAGTGAVNGSTIKVYIDGVLLGSTTASSTSWSITGLGTYDVYAGGKLTATITTSPNCESTTSASVTVQCSAPASTPTRTLTTATICSGNSASVTVASSESGVTYQLYNGGATSGASVLGTAGTISLTSAALTTNPTSLQVVASKVSAVTCQTNIGTAVSITVNTWPSVGTLSITTTPACNNGTASLSLTTTVNTNTYQLRRGSTNEGASQAGNGGSLTFTTAAVNGSTSFTVLVTSNSTGCTNSSNSVSVTPSGGPSASQLVTVTNSTVCVNSTTNINVTTENNAAYTYQIKELGTNTNVGTSFVGNGTIISRSPTALATAGSKTYYVVVTNASCTVNLTTQPTITWNNSPSTAAAGSAQTVCGTSTTLSATSPTSGTGAWSQVSGPNTATFSSTTSTTPTVSNLVSGAYVFRWTVSITCSGSTQTSTNDVTVTVNCAATYSVATAKVLNSYSVNEVLATPSDVDGTVSNAVLAGGSSLPPGTALNASTGIITVSNTSALVSGAYMFTITTTDSKSIAHTVSVTMSFSPNNASLPVDLVSFKAKAKKEGVLLEWMTMSEYNNDHFEIERSADAATFETIQKVKGAGTTKQVTRYHWTDPLPLTGANYYRLHQVDYDGTTKYSGIIHVDGSQLVTAAIEVYPNPSQGFFTLALFAEQTQPLLLQVRDMSNKVLMEKKVEVEEGKNELPLDLSHLPDGLYVLMAKGTQLQYVQRIIKMK